MRYLTQKYCFETITIKIILVGYEKLLLVLSKSNKEIIHSLKLNFNNTFLFKRLNRFEKRKKGSKLMC